MGVRHGSDGYMHPKRTETVLSVMSGNQDLEHDHAAGVSTDDLCTLLDATAADQYLTAEERETAINWSAADDEAGFYTEVPSLIRRFLLHPEATVQTIRVTDENARSTPDGRFGARIEPQQYESGMITGVKGSIPYRAVKLQPSARNTPGMGHVISQEVLDNDPRK